MRPTNSSDSSSRLPSVVNSQPTLDDTMLMGFEFFDEKGHLNPRKVLFSAQTSPSKANSITTALFGKIMQWGASRWAENFLKCAQKNQSASKNETRQKIAELLTDIRKNGSVKMARFFEVSMPVIIETERSEYLTTKNLIPKNKKIPTFHAAPSIINANDVIQYYSTTSPKKSLPLRNGLIGSPKTQRNEFIESIIDKLINYQKIFLATGKPETTLTKYITSVFESGFLEYCQFGPSALRNIDIQNLEIFLRDYRNNWKNLNDVLSDDQFSHLIEQKNKIMVDIASYKKMNYDRERISEEKEENLIKSEMIIDDEKSVKRVRHEGIFHNQPDVNYEDLDRIDWEGNDYHRQISDADARKICQYFSIALPDEENLKLAKRIFSLAKKIQLTALTDAITTADDSPTELKDPGTLLVEAYRDFLERYKRSTDNDKRSVSITKKSKIKKSDTNRPERIEKARKKKKIDGDKNPLQVSRKQYDDSNGVTGRANKKTAASPKKISKHFL